MAYMIDIYPGLRGFLVCNNCNRLLGIVNVEGTITENYGSRGYNHFFKCRKFLAKYIFPNSEKICDVENPWKKFDAYEPLLDTSNYVNYKTPSP